MTGCRALMICITPTSTERRSLRHLSSPRVTIAHRFTWISSDLISQLALDFNCRSSVNSCLLLRWTSGPRFSANENHLEIWWKYHSVIIYESTHPTRWCFWKRWNVRWICILCCRIRSGIGVDDNEWASGSPPLPLHLPDKAYLIGQPNYRNG